jgi:hypothetical protein
MLAKVKIVMISKYCHPNNPLTHNYIQRGIKVLKAKEIIKVAIKEGASLRPSALLVD